jgi:hypothetical protein
MSVRSSAGLWDSETCALFRLGRKIMSLMKEKLIQQLLDGDLRSYLMEMLNISRVLTGKN